MNELALAVGLLLLVEGAVYALFPAQMKVLLRRTLELPDSALRNVGSCAVVVGLLVVWLFTR